MATLANMLTMQLASNLLKAKAVQKPSPFKGECSDNTHCFFVAFTMWVMAQGTALNVVDQQGDPVDQCDAEWIRAALSYLQDDAAVWAVPVMEEFTEGTAPFSSQWHIF